MERSFVFRAVQRDGALIGEVVDADSALAARDIVSSRGLFVLSMKDAAARIDRRARLSAADLALGLRILADLLESGLPVTRALVAFEELAPQGWRPALPQIRESVRQGRSMAAAFSAAPIDIPALVIGIAQAGEAGSGIGPAVRRAADLMEAAAETRAAVRSALAYPAVVAVAGLSAITVLITVVLPRFARILSDLGQTLPASTRFVLKGSATVRTGLIPAAIVGALGFVAWRAWVRTRAGLERWHSLLLATPVVGPLRHGIAAARVAHSLQAMLDSGVPISNAIGIAARASGDAEIERRLGDVRGMLVAGESLSGALQRCGAATPTMVRLIRAGEESGRLPSMLGHAAKIEQKRVDQVVRTAVRLLEPILLLTFAGMVALVAAALLQAIYSVRPSA